MNQLFLYSQGQDTFRTPLAQRAMKNTMPSGTHNSASGDNLSPPSTVDGSGDGENGGNRGTNDIGTSQSFRPSSRDVNRTMSDHNGKRGEEYEEETIAHTYRRLRKAKDNATKGPPNYNNQVVHRYADEQQMPSTFTPPGYCNWSCGSNNYDNGQYNYGYNQTNTDWGTFESDFTQSNPNTQNHDNFQVFKHGTINYGDHHYYHPIIHGRDSSSSGQSWIDATSSYFFQEQGIDRDYTADQNKETNYQEAARRSFW
ncbi:hypothetical protein Cgig2_027349 [Carnegiea gigantea]|uniref:Uncharacterized protein n=1 Tax=Carnegiea gigantea TaxID=171969 RepID=A0A9Q1JID0_9CARY|nr:hypothetical protein Cgig2_027349 [Carnegiea gigantea]